MNVQRRTLLKGLGSAGLLGTAGVVASADDDVAPDACIIECCNDPCPPLCGQCICSRYC